MCEQCEEHPRAVQHSGHVMVVLAMNRGTDNLAALRTLYDRFRIGDDLSSQRAVRAVLDYAARLYFLPTRTRRERRRMTRMHATQYFAKGVLPTYALQACGTANPVGGPLFSAARTR